MGVKGLMAFFKKKKQGVYFDPQDLIFNSPLQLLDMYLFISYKNLVINQDNNFSLMSLSINVTYLLDNV